MNRSFQSFELLRFAAVVLPAAFVFGCAATPAARWDTTERAHMASEFPKCQFIEDKDEHAAGYACDLGNFFAYVVPPGENHEKTAKRLAELNGKVPFTPPLDKVIKRDPITVSNETFDASIATYRPEEGTIMQPEMLMILTSKQPDKPIAYTCGIILLAGLDTEESIKGRLGACMAGLQLLVEASK